MPAVVSKRGVDGNQKGGSSLQPAQESCVYYSIKRNKSSEKKPGASNILRREAFSLPSVEGTRHEEPGLMKLNKGSQE